jgi:hypothetical protein
VYVYPLPPVAAIVTVVVPLTVAPLVGLVNDTVSGVDGGGGVLPPPPLRM